MPFKSEHSARIKRPKPDAKYWRRNFENGLGVVIMNGSVQSIRFKTAYWTVVEAKRYLRQGGWKVLKFEKAQES